MKRNVDLTHNRIFTTPEEPTGMIKLLLDSIKNTKPWDVEKTLKVRGSDLDFAVKSELRQVFAIGSKEERERWKRNRACDNDEMCDRCGMRTGRKPWAKIRCNCYSMTHSSKIPWKF